MPGLLTRSFAVLLLAQSSFGFGFSCFFLLPKFVTQELGGSPSEIGLVMAAFGATSILFIPLVGDWIDRVGRRPFIVAGAIVMTLASLAFLAVDRVGPLLYALRMVQGVAFAAVFISASTLVTDDAPPEHLGRAIGLFGVSILSMHALAPAVAEEVAGRFGWHAVFWMAAASSLVCLASTPFIYDPPHAHGVAGGPGILEMMRRPRSLRVGAVVALTGAAFGAMMTYPQAFALALGRTHVRGFFVAYALAAVAVRLGFGGLADRLGRRRVSLGSLVAYGAVVLAMAWLRPSLLEPLGLVFGAAHGLFYPAYNALAVEEAGPGERGKVMALFNGAFNLGNSGATLGLGFVAESFGYPAVFWIAAAGVFAAYACLRASPDGRPAPAAAARPAEA
jgi:MFS family permease